MGPNPKPCPPPSNFARRSVSAFAIFIGAIGIGCGVWTLLQTLKCERWPTTEAVITAATISHSKQENASISYIYQVAGIPYTGNRLASGQDMAHGRWILEKYPVGKKVPVHYSSADPQLAVLETGIHAGTWNYFGVGTGFMLFGWVFLRFPDSQPRKNPI